MGHCLSSCLKSQVSYKNNNNNNNSDSSKNKLSTPPQIDMYNVIIEYDKDNNSTKPKPIIDVNKSSSPSANQMASNEAGEFIVNNNLHFSSKLSKTSLSTGSGNLSMGSCKKVDNIPSDSPGKKIQILYDKYKDKDNPNCILAEGIERFCMDLGLNPDDFEVLALAWQFNTETMSCFTNEEFIKGCHTLNVHTIQEIQAKLPEISKRAVNDFKNFYKWAFQFGLEPPQRFLPLEMAVALWKLLYQKIDPKPPLLTRWLEFLNTLNPTTCSIKRDTWDMLLRFMETFQTQENLLQQYTDLEAWPSLFDDFVEFERNNNSNNTNNKNNNNNSNNNGDTINDIAIVTDVDKTDSSNQYG